MSRAVLEIEADVTGLRAAFLSAREESRRVHDAFIEDARRAGTVQRAMWRSVQKQALEALAAVREEEERTTAQLEALAARRRALAESEKTHRSGSARETADHAGRAEDAITRNHERASSRRKKVTEDEARHAMRAARDIEKAWREHGRNAGGRAWEIASQAGSQVLGDARSERERVAITERLTGNAMYQAGATRGDVATATRSIQRFAAVHNMDETEIARALAASQTEFSVLGDRTTSRAERNQALGRFLETTRLARDTGNDMGEFGRLQGLFADTRLAPQTQRQLLLYAAGAAQRGAIEVGAITREAMPAMRAQIGRAIEGAQRNGTDPQEAARTAFIEMMAELEIARSAGETPRAAGNAIASVSNALASRLTQSRLLTNIREDLGDRSTLERRLFEADPEHHGEKRLKREYQNALNLVTVVGEEGLGMGEFMNLTRGGGQGNPMSLLSNQRRVLGELLNADASGRRGYTRVRDLMDVERTALSERDVTRGGELFGRDTLGELEGNRARRGLELTDPALSRTVSSLDRFAAEHPLLAPVASGVGSLVGDKLVRGVGARLGGLLSPRTVGGAGGALRYLGPVGAFMGTFFGTDALTGANTSAASARYGSRDAIDGGSDAAMIRAHREAGGGSVGQEAALRAMQDAVARGVERGMQQAHVTATIDPHDAAHAASSNASARSLPR